MSVTQKTGSYSLVALLLTLLALGATACGEKNQLAESATVIPVETELPRLEPIRATLKTAGALYARETAVISPKIPGRIARMLVDEGSRVAAGQMVAELDDTQITLAVRQAEQSLAQAEAGLAQAQAAIIQAEANQVTVARDFERISNLFTKQSIAQQQYDHAASGKRAADAALSAALQRQTQAEAAREAARLAVEMARSNLADCRVLAPIAGVITEKTKNLGEVVNAGTELYRLEQISVLKLKANVAATHLPHLAIGGAARATIAGVPEPLHLRIDEIGPRIDPADRSVVITCLIANTDGRLVSGLYADLEITLQEVPEALTVSRAALLNEAGRYWLFTVEGNAARRKEVTIGLIARSRVEIREGLAAGETVIHTGQTFLADGTPVNVLTKGN